MDKVYNYYNKYSVGKFLSTPYIYFMMILG